MLKAWILTEDENNKSQMIASTGDEYSIDNYQSKTGEFGMEDTVAGTFNINEVAEYDTREFNLFFGDKEIRARDYLSNDVPFKLLKRKYIFKESLGVAGAVGDALKITMGVVIEGARVKSNHSVSGSKNRSPFEDISLLNDNLRCALYELRGYGYRSTYK